jgi:hypothetical protein
LKADVGRLQGGLNDVRNMAMLMPLLSTQTTRELQGPVGALQKGDRVVIDSGDIFSKMLPMLLFSGSFGGGSGQPGQSGGGMFGGDSSGIMLIAMMMAMQGKK